MTIFLVALFTISSATPIDPGNIGAYGPFAKPRSFPGSMNPMPPQIAIESPDGAPMPPMTSPAPENPPAQLGYEDAFPVLNVRYQYPPTSLDSMRQTYLSEVNANLISNARLTNSDMNSYMGSFEVHFNRISKIVGYLRVLPRNLKSKLQNYLLRVLADHGIPEVPADILVNPRETAMNDFRKKAFGEQLGRKLLAGKSPVLPRFSLLQTGPGDFETTEENPQINVGIEDNLNEFAVGAEMTLTDADSFLKEVSQSWHLCRHMVLELLKVKLKQLQLIMTYLYPRLFRTTLKVRTLRSDQQKEEAKLVKQQQQSLIQRHEAPGQTDYSDELSLMQRTQKTVPALLNDTSVFFNKTSKIDPGSIAPVGSLDMATVAELRSRVMQSGRTGATALAGLIDLWDQEYGWRDLIRKSLVNVDCRLLLSIAKTPDYVKNLAGTLLTLMTGVPVSVSVAEMASGSYGHVSLIVPRPSRTYLPDKEIALTTGG